MRPEPANLPDSELRSDSGALRRGFAVLDLLLQSSHPMSSREIADALGLSDSTAHRLLQSLCDTGHVLRDGTRRYMAGSKAMLPLAIYHPLNVLRRDAFEPLRALRDEFGVTASVVVFVGGERVLLDVLGVTGMLAPYYETRLDNPLHVSASGKLMLLAMTDAERKAELGDPPFRQLTPRTLTSKAQLARNLAAAAAQGFATNIDENFLGFSAIAAPLTGAVEKVIGCLALAGASERFTSKRLDQMGPSLRSSAQLISSGSQAIRAVQAMLGKAR